MPDDKLFTTQATALDNEGQPNIVFLQSLLSRFKAKGGERERKLIEQAYYKNDNDIKNKLRTYIDENGNEQEAKLLSNNKLSHPFARKLTKQKTNYLLSKIFTIKSDDKAFLELLNKFFNEDFHALIKNVGNNAVTNAVAWVQVYYNPDSELKFKRINPDEVIAKWADADHTELTAILRFYVVENLDEDGNITDITKVEYYTNEGVWYFVEDDKGKLTPDADKPFSGHYVTNELDEDGNEVLTETSWTQIPFVAFKYNSDELSLLQLIKSKVDSYDSVTSKTGDSIEDVPNSTKIIKNYDGATGEREAFNKNLNTFGNIFVRGDGDVTTLPVEIDIAAIDGYLDRLKTDIYDAGNGVDMQRTDTGDKSGNALKYNFSDLDMDTDDMANEFRPAIKRLVWFIKEDAIIKGLGDFTDSIFEIIFNKDIAINELEAMDICVKAQSIAGISMNTIVSNAPIVTDAEKEIKAWENEQQAALNQIQTDRDNATEDEDGQ